MKKAYIFLSYISLKKLQVKNSPILWGSFEIEVNILNHEFPFLIYRSAEEDISVNAIIKDETIWANTKNQWQNCFDVDKSTNKQTLKKYFFQDGEFKRKKWLLQKLQQPLRMER